MKSIKFFAVASAVALLGTAGLTSCNQKNGPEIDPGNQVYNGETVKTEFLINIADNVAGAPNRMNMPGTTVQIDDEANDPTSPNYGGRDEFRGMTDIILVPLFPDPSSTSMARSGQNITLGEIGGAVPSTPYTPTYGTMTKQSTIIYDNIAVPIGTTQFLFYGRAKDNPSDDAGWHEYGVVTREKLTETNDYNDPSKIAFHLNPIYSGTGHAKATALVNYLNTIAQTEVNSIPWKNSTGNQGVKDMYTTFTKLRAGSSAAVLATVTDLYNTLEKIQKGLKENAIAIYVIDHPAADDNEKAEIGNAAKDAMADAIMTNIKAKTSGWNAGEEGARTLAFTDDDLKNYPGVIYLPEGAAALTFEGDAFAVGTEALSNSGNNFGALNSFVYPPSLQYFAKSSIVTSSSSQKSLYDATNDWETILNNGYNDNKTDGSKVTSVTAGTKSVAIHDNIQYAVGQLQVQVKRTTEPLVDSKGYEYNCQEMLQWKGVLIGGQKSVKYDFTYNTDATDVFTIYDNCLDGCTTENPTKKIGTAFSGGEAPNTYGGVNYTLVFSTKDNPTSSDAVYVAIELVNTNAAFYGVGEQLIPAGATFYLVGKLDSSVNTEVNTTHSPANGNIFYKDYITKANFTITSLRNAYYTIPDLRISNLELGFSVDLTWQAGLEFNINL